MKPPNGVLTSGRFWSTVYAIIHWNMPEIGFSLTRIFPYNDRIYDSVVALENISHKKSVFRRILSNANL